MNRRTAPYVIFAAALVGAPWACGSSGKNGAGSGPDGGSPDGSVGASSSGGGSGGGSSGGSSGSSGGSGGGSSGGSSGSSSGGADGGGDAGFDAGASVLMRGNDVYRRGNFTGPGLTFSSVSTMAPDTAFNTAATFPANGHTTGQGLASLLYLEQGPAAAGCPTGATGCTATSRAAGAGIFLVFPALGATPNAIAFDETTGLRTWSATLSNGAAGGGDGIRGTPVIDATKRLVYAVTGNNPHVVHAISVDTGVEVTTGGWPVTLQLTTLSSQTDAGFDSSVQNQRGALLLVNGILYIPFGGEDGDGGNYLGWIVAIDTTTPSKVAGWATISTKSGIWASGGLASDGTYVFGETGNCPGGPARSALDSEEVVRVKGMAEFSRDEASVFVANEWSAWDDGDLDFGSSSPAFVPLPPGSNPPSVLVAPAKAGVVYFLNGSDLSTGTYPNVGGELTELTVAGGGQSIYTSPTIYTSGSGLHAAINAGAGPFSACPAGSPSSNGMIISMSISPGKTPIASVAWCAANDIGTGNREFPPISTTSDGVSADPIVWFLSGASGASTNQLTGVNGEDGGVLVTTTGTGCATVPSLSYPIAVKNRIVVAAIGHLCSWSVGGK